MWETMKINGMNKQSIRIALTTKLNEIGQKYNGQDVVSALPKILFELTDYTGALLDAEFELRRGSDLSFAEGTNTVNLKDGDVK